MTSELTNVNELLPLLESSDLQRLEQVKAAINDQLSTDRGSLVLSSLVEFYLESSSPQAALLLSSVREPHDKLLLDKLNESLLKSGTRLAALTLLGQVVQKQPPWVHKIARLPLLNSLLKCLKTDSDVVNLITGVLVLVSLLPMVPHAGKQHIYDSFDVFGRLAAWSLKNPGHIPGVFLLHLHASVYCLFHRLYGMFPCNFISYLRLHYSMKENLDTFQELVKPMLEHVRVHPELVTGTPDYELDSSRWKCYEVHDIVIECAKVCLDPREASFEDSYSSLPDHTSFLKPTPFSSLPRLDLTSSPQLQPLISMGSSASIPLSAEQTSLSQSTYQQAGVKPYIQQCEADEVTWSPSSECDLATPPISRGISPANVLESSQGSYSQPPSRTASISGVKSPSSTTAEENQHGDSNSLPKKLPVVDVDGSASQPIPEERSYGEDVNNDREQRVQSNLSVYLEGQRSLSLTEVSDFIRERDMEFGHTTGHKERDDEEMLKLVVSQPPSFPSSTPSHTGPQASMSNLPLHWSLWPSFTPIQARSPGGLNERGQRSVKLEDGGPSQFCPPSPDQANVPPYELLFQLALPRAASLFISRKTQELVERAQGKQEKRVWDGEEAEEEDCSSCSPLELLDRLILQGHQAHQRLSRRLSMPNKSVDWSHFGGKQQSMKAKGSTQEEELQTVRSQLLLMYSQLQYERYKRQQHAIRNRRLLRQVINATTLEEHNHSMREQLGLQDVEIQSLKSSLAEEQRRYTQLQQESYSHATRLHTQIQQLQRQHQEECTKNQRLQSELQECHSRLGELEVELQKANNEVYSAEHQLTQMSLKLVSSEEIQQQMSLLNRQLLLLQETNRLLTFQQERDPLYQQEVAMLQSMVIREEKRLRESEAKKSQRLEAANHRICELEAQLNRKDQLILEQKKLLEETKSQAKAQLLASECCSLTLRRVTQALQTEMLQLYSQIDLNMYSTTHSSSHIQSEEQGLSTNSNQPTSSSSSIINGSLEPLSTSPLHLLSTSSPLSLSPIDLPLAVGSYPTEGSFLEQRARQLFRLPGNEQGEEEELEEAQEEGLSVGQEAEEVSLHPGGLQSSSQEMAPSVTPPDPRASQPSPDPTEENSWRRHQLSIMDYDESLPEY